MYTKEEASRVKQEFWITFGQYLAPYKSIDGQKVNWVNYKTGFKHVYFKMDADKREANIGINISHPDEGIQELFFEQFLEYKQIFEANIKEDWTWELHATDEYNRTVSKIYTSLKPINIFNKQDWPQLISFFKQRILALDEFWYDVKDGFEALK